MQTDIEKEYWDCTYKRIRAFLEDQDKSPDTSCSIPAGEALGYIERYEKNGCTAEQICRFVRIQTNYDGDDEYRYGFDRRGDDFFDISKEIGNIMYDVQQKMGVSGEIVFPMNAYDEYREYLKKYGYN